MQDLLIDRVNIYRNTDVLAANSAMPISITPAGTFDPAVVLEFTIPSGTTGTFQVVGTSNMVGVTETVNITTSQTSKITLNAYSAISSISSVAGTATTASVKYKNKSGQPYYIEQTLLSNAPARISKNRQGVLSIRREILTSQDEHVLFIIHGPALLKSKDEVVDIGSGDRFMCIDVDDVSDSFAYHHSEIVISLINSGVD